MEKTPTDRQMVLAKHPRAYVRKYVSTAVDVYIVNGGGKTLGEGHDATSAWRNAAARL